MKARRSASPRSHSPHVRQSWVEKDRQGPGQPRWRDSRMRHLEDEYRSWRQGRWEVFADELGPADEAPTWRGVPDGEDVR